MVLFVLWVDLEHCKRDLAGSRVLFLGVLICCQVVLGGSRVLQGHFGWFCDAFLTVPRVLLGWIVLGCC